MIYHDSFVVIVIVTVVAIIIPLHIDTLQIIFFLLFYTYMYTCGCMGV